MDNLDFDRVKTLREKVAKPEERPPSEEIRSIPCVAPGCDGILSIESTEIARKFDMHELIGPGNRRKPEYKNRAVCSNESCLLKFNTKKVQKAIKRVNDTRNR